MNLVLEKKCVLGLSSRCDNYSARIEGAPVCKAQCPFTEEPKLDSKTEFCTSQGWKGKKYEETHKLSLKEIAQRIKREILTKHPEIKVSVKTEHFANGCAINIDVTSVPFKAFIKEIMIPGSKYFTLHYTEQGKVLMDEIQSIANQYRRDDSDPQTDYFNTNFYCTPEFSYQIRRKEEQELGMA